MIIDKVEIRKGERKTVKLSVGTLPSGTKIELQIEVFRSELDGPCLLVLGGLHGDETNGVEIVRRALKNRLFDNIKIGSVIAIPLVNVHGFINKQRTLPDGKDINRSFPGSSRGSLASRVAYKLSKHILPHVNYGIDFHTGGKQLHNHPQIRVSSLEGECIAFAKAFGAPYIIHSKTITKSLRKECGSYGIEMLVYEGGESLRLDAHSVQEGYQGLRRALKFLKMNEDELPVTKSLVLKDDSWIRAGKSGIFVPYKVSGDRVEEGEIIGYISGPYEGKVLEVKSKSNGVIFGHNNMPVVNIGEPLFHLGW